MDCAEAESRYRLVADFHGPQAVLRFRVEPATYYTQFDAIRESGGAGEGSQPGVCRLAMRVEALRFDSEADASRKCRELNARSREWDGI